MSNTTDTNQASEVPPERGGFNERLDGILRSYIGNYVTADEYERHVTEAKQAIKAILRTEKLKLLNELDKSMPTAEQLTTKYGYHMPEKQYGYKLALHDIREVLTKLEAEL